MKTKIIPFDLETAKKIQAGEVKGKIKTRDSKHKMRIVCYNSTARYCGSLQPIIAQDIEDCGGLYAYFKDGAYIEEKENPRDLVLEVPDDEPQFEPFDKVLVRNKETDKWHPNFYATTDGLLYYTIDCKNWQQCIHYEGNKHLVGTTDKQKEE